MADLSRIGVAIDSDLLQKFDDLIATRGYSNRSEAFRDLIRAELVEASWQAPDSQVVGTVTLVYNHHVRLLSEKLTEFQHEHFHNVLSALHVHLDHDNCLEVILVRGKACHPYNVGSEHEVTIAELAKATPTSTAATQLAACVNGRTAPVERPKRPRESPKRDLLHAAFLAAGCAIFLSAGGAFRCRPMRRRGPRSGSTGRT